MNWHLAQVNIAVAKYNYEDPLFAGFVGNLDRINALADNASGFVWRYVSEDETAAGRDEFDDEKMLFNMSVWESKAALMDYVYQTAHVDILRKRADWFLPSSKPGLALWWQAAGTLPSVADANQRLETLNQDGPGEEAFTFRYFFEPPATSNG